MAKNIEIKSQAKKKEKTLLWIFMLLPRYNRVRRSARQQLLQDVLHGNARVSSAKKKYTEQSKATDKLGSGNLDRRETQWLKKLLKEARCQ